MKKLVTKLERLAVDKYRVVDGDGGVLAYALALPGNCWGIFDDSDMVKRLDDGVFKDPNSILELYKAMN